MDVRKVNVEIDGVMDDAFFECGKNRITMKVTMPDGVIKDYAGMDYYVCLGEVRKDFPNVRFLCKGAKINVYPSRMCSQMAGGIVAYEVCWGEPADNNNIVNIFDYEDQNLTHDINEQADYYRRWMGSLGCKG
ncbi:MULTISPECIES: hypothetical protein [unclassified Pseudomonas]|uniref:hypothetical protein n=1 Tax=unclassified Pseudomonas TaxID=196821 RepID=UPI000B874BEB|nr:MULTISPECIES: hypothetical protein [unclassified Pseudomonas]